MEGDLLLDQGYSPITVISWKRAVILAFLDKAEVIESQGTIKGVSRTFEKPSIVRLLNSTPYIVKRPKFSKRNILERDDYTCQYCYRTLTKSKLTIDHIIPKSKGGKTSWTNCVTCCRECNQYKGDMLLKEAGMSLKITPKKPNNWMIGKIAKEEFERWKNSFNLTS